MKKEKIYLDLSKLTEEQRSKAISMLPEANIFTDYEYLPGGNYIYLLFDMEIGANEWFVDDSNQNKKEVSFN